MAHVEYLKNFRPDLLSGTVDDMMRAGKLQDRATLIEYLGGALEYLKTVPGPNLQYRKDNADGWIGWWINFLGKDQTPGQLVPFENIKEVLSRDKTSGVLFGGKSEGHNGHRFAVNWIADHVDQPILLLEREWYAEADTRGGRFIDLRAGISMWTYYNPRIIVSVMPQKDTEVVAEVHYQKLFDQTGADHCFASNHDRYWKQKVSRGKSTPFLLIPSVFVESTSGQVKALEQTQDVDGLRTLLNTTDLTRRLLDPTTPMGFGDAVLGLGLIDLQHYQEPELTKI